MRLAIKIEDKDMHLRTFCSSLRYVWGLARSLYRIIHQDVKIENLVLGSDGRVKICCSRGKVCG